MLVNKIDQLAKVFLWAKPGPFLDDRLMIPIALDKKMVDIIYIPSSNGIVLCIPVGHRHQFVGKRCTDGLAVDQTVNLWKILHPILVGRNFYVGNADFYGNPLSRTARITELKGEHILEFRGYI